MIDKELIIGFLRERHLNCSRMRLGGRLFSEYFYIFKFWTIWMNYLFKTHELFFLFWDLMAPSWILQPYRKYISFLWGTLYQSSNSLWGLKSLASMRWLPVSHFSPRPHHFPASMSDTLPSDISVSLQIWACYWKFSGFYRFTHITFGRREQSRRCAIIFPFLVSTFKVVPHTFLVAAGDFCYYLMLFLFQCIWYLGKEILISLAII